MQKITKKQIEKAKEGEILASGFLENSPGKVFLTRDPRAKKRVKYIAIRGYIADWAIYVENLYNDNYIGRTNWQIKREGDKISPERVKYIDDLEVEDEALMLYRR